MGTRNISRALGLVVLATFLGTTMAPVASIASVEGKRNTAIGLTAGAIYSAVRGKKTAAIGLGAGAAYAWKRHSDARKNQAYRRGYHSGYNNGYHRGYRNAKYHRHHRRH